jgi:AcrR family transcriptional regulator
METADRLLETAEELMLEAFPDRVPTLEGIAREAGVGEAAARRCFQDLDDLIHVGARRALAIEGLSFIDMMVKHRFESRSDVALAIVAFVLMSNAERDGLPPGVNRQIRKDSFEITRNSARAMAEAIQATKRVADRPCLGLASSEIATALTATAAAARTLIDFDAAALGRPRNQDWLLQISIAALGVEAA